jgi:hypothetical protein
MTDKRFIQIGFDRVLSHSIEEAGEFLTAAGKTQRWGGRSINPIYDEVPDGSRGEMNGRWLWREIQDLESVLKRLKKEMIKEFDKGDFDQNKDGSWVEE